MFIAPLSMSGGTRLKVFEDMSMAKAVVSTSIDREDIDVSHREHQVTVSEPRTFESLR